MSHASSGTGQPFGGHTVFDSGGMVSDRGAAQVIVGKRPVVQDPNDDDGDTPTAVRLPGWITVVNLPDLVIYRSPD